MGLLRVLLEISRPAMPPVAFQAFAFEPSRGEHLQGLLNQAIIAQEDVEGYFVLRRVSFIIAAAVGRQLAARRV